MDTASTGAAGVAASSVTAAGGSGRATGARVAVFVDGANMFYAQKTLGWYVDWSRVLRHLTAGRLLYNAFYYTTLATRPADEGFHQYLVNTGYTVRRKALKRVYDEITGTYIEKANLDVEIVVDMFNTLPLYDEAVLCSGDSDFERAVELLRSKGKLITVVATHRNISFELRNAADRFVDLADIRDHVERLDRPAPTFPTVPAAGATMSPLPAG
jgi:uncharacterized LabA/DUF88 family protein